MREARNEKGREGAGAAAAVSVLLNLEIRGPRGASQGKVPL